MRLFRRKKRDPYPNPREVREWFESYVDYWESRLDAGDPLLNQWMWDAYEAARDGVLVMDRLHRAGLQTKRSPRRAA